MGAKMHEISFVYQTAKILATFISIQRAENQDYFENSIEVLAVIWIPEVS